MDSMGRVAVRYKFYPDKLFSRSFEYHSAGEFLQQEAQGL